MTVRESEFVRKYGITFAQRDTIFEAQGRVCGCCGSPTPQGKRGWAMDHDHVTGRIRGVVCQKCNFGLGHFDDDPTKLHAAVRYLEKHKNSGAPVVPVQRKTPRKPRRT